MPKSKISLEKENLPAKHPGGRPPKFTDAKELQIKIDAFFKFCDDKILPYTIHGLCVALECCRDTLCEYEKQPQFSDAIKRAKEKIRWYVEKEMLMGRNPAGMIFWLKNNAGWKDSQEIKHSGSINFAQLSDEELEAIAAGQGEA